MSFSDFLRARMLASAMANAAARQPPPPDPRVTPMSFPDPTAAERMWLAGPGVPRATIEFHARDAAPMGSRATITPANAAAYLPGAALAAAAAANVAPMPGMYGRPEHPLAEAARVARGVAPMPGHYGTPPPAPPPPPPPPMAPAPAGAFPDPTAAQRM